MEIMKSRIWDKVKFSGLGNCKFNFTTALMFFVALLSKNFLFAAEMVPPSRNELVEFYIQNAFANGNLALRKFETGPKIPISVACESLPQDICNQSNESIKMSWEPSENLQWELSPKPVIEFVFADDAHLNGISPKTAQEFSNSFSDVSDPQCEVFSKYSNNRITQGKLLVSTEQPQNKLRACLIVQIPRLLGLDYYATGKFSVIWESVFSKLSEEKLNHIHQADTVIEYIHMCPELKVGMREDEVSKILTPFNSCISKVEGIK